MHKSYLAKAPIQPSNTYVLNNFISMNNLEHKVDFLEIENHCVSYICVPAHQSYPYILYQRSMQRI